MITAVRFVNSLNNAFQITELTRTNKFADEIRDEQEERKREDIKSKEKKAAFKAKAAKFGTSIG